MSGFFRESRASMSVREYYHALPALSADGNGAQGLHHDDGHQQMASAERPLGRDMLQRIPPGQDLPLHVAGTFSRGGGPRLLDQDTDRVLWQAGRANARRNRRGGLRLLWKDDHP